MLMRTIAIAIVALSAGAVGGVVFSQARLGTQLQAVAEERNALSTERDALKRKFADLQARQEGLESDNHRLHEQLELAKVQPSTSPSPQEMPLESVEDPSVELPEQDSPMDASASRDRRRDRDGESNEPATPEELAREEERRQEREQRMTEFRDRMSQFFTGEMEKTGDAAVQQRLSQLNEYAQYSMDLRRQMRDAQTDEERQVLQEQLEQASTATRTLVKDQQDYLMRQSLTTNGVADAATQDALINSLRTTMESPFFRMPMGGGGGGGGPWGGSWGGRGGPQGQRGGGQ
ncbi:MAG: hypothetical protein WC655_03085 [Candidatus Hydrogenedentales bacterium]|jgi:hypothetical protein